VSFDPSRDYPLGTSRPELVRTPGGIALDELELHGERVEAAELRATPDTLRMQADVARSSGREQLADNLLRAAELAPLPDETVVHKTTFGAFNSSNLDYVLREQGIRNLVVTGISTNCCVETTARDAADRGYGVVICADATADYDEPGHDAALRAFHFNFGRIVVSADEILRAVDAEADV